MMIWNDIASAVVNKNESTKSEDISLLQKELSTTTFERIIIFCSPKCKRYSKEGFLFSIRRANVIKPFASQFPYHCHTDHFYYFYSDRRQHLLQVVVSQLCGPDLASSLWVELQFIWELNYKLEPLLNNI